MGFREWLLTLESLDLLDIALPFLLIFTIVFAVLQKTRLLGEEARRFNVIISFVLSMAAVIPHAIGGQPDVVVIINSALPHVSLLMIASLSALLLIGIFGSEVNIAGSGLSGWVVLFSIVAVAYTFLASAGVVGRLPPPFDTLLDPETRSLLVAILVFGIIVWFITKEERPEEKRQPIGKTINDMFGGVLGGKHK